MVYLSIYVPVDIPFGTVGERIALRRSLPDPSKTSSGCVSYPPTTPLSISTRRYLVSDDVIRKVRRSNNTIGTILIKAQKYYNKLRRYIENLFANTIL